MKNIRREGLWVVVSVVLLIGFASCRTTASLLPARYTPVTNARIDSVCEAHMAKYHYPGLAVAVIADNRYIWSRGYGYADIQSEQKTDPATSLFRIGSISKTVTATGLARLSGKGKIDLDLPIGRYMPECPDDKSELTLRQLGGHLGGIRHYRGAEFLSQIHYPDVIAPLSVFIQDTLLFAPGSAYSYTTYGWTLISAVMEKAVGIPFATLIEKEVIQPLRLHALKTDDIDSTQYERVTFYEYQQDSFVVGPFVDNSNKWAGGGYVCTAEDLARFGMAWTKNGYLKKSVRKEYATSQKTSSGKVTHYGIGLAVNQDTAGRTWIGHSGGSVGGTSMMLIYPEEKWIIITLVNLSSANMDQLAWKIAEVLRTE